MNNIIKKQLNKCRVANIPEFNDDTTTLIIPKSGSKKVELIDYAVGKQYQIFIEDSLIKHCDWYDKIHGTWNNGVGPTSNKINCTVTQLMGKMIRVSGEEVISGRHWEGWLPKGNVTKIKEL